MPMDGSGWWQVKGKGGGARLWRLQPSWVNSLPFFASSFLFSPFPCCRIFFSSASIPLAAGGMALERDCTGYYLRLERPSCDCDGRDGGVDGSLDRRDN